MRRDWARLSCPGSSVVAEIGQASEPNPLICIPKNGVISLSLDTNFVPDILEGVSSPDCIPSVILVNVRMTLLETFLHTVRHIGQKFVESVHIWKALERQNLVNTLVCSSIVFKSAPSGVWRPVAGRSHQKPFSAEKYLV